MRVIWSRLARTRRLEILRYISRYNNDAARKMDVLFRQSAKRLVSFPHSGVAGRIEGTRELTVHPNYIVVYKVSQEVIEIITIAHAAQLFPAIDGL